MTERMESQSATVPRRTHRLARPPRGAAPLRDRTLAEWVRAALPSGDALPDALWERHHRLVLRVLVVLAFTGEEIEAARKVFDEMITLGRHATPEEIAQAVLYLAAESGAMVNSQQFSIDGGLSAM